MSQHKTIYKVVATRESRPNKDDKITPLEKSYTLAHRPEDRSLVYKIIGPDEELAHKNCDLCYPAVKIENDPVNRRARKQKENPTRLAKKPLPVEETPTPLENEGKIADFLTEKQAHDIGEQMGVILAALDAISTIHNAVVLTAIKTQPLPTDADIAERTIAAMCEPIWDACEGSAEWEGGRGPSWNEVLTEERFDDFRHLTAMRAYLLREILDIDIESVNGFKGPSTTFPFVMLAARGNLPAFEQPTQP